LGELETQGAVAIVEIEPIVSGLQREGRGDADGFVSRAGDLEEDAVLPLELDFLVVQSPGQQHGLVGGQQLLLAELSWRAFLGFGGSRHGHGKYSSRRPAPRAENALFSLALPMRDGVGVSSRTKQP